MVNVLSRGIIYIVTGQKHATEAWGSAVSVKQCMPEIPIAIFSDISPVSGIFDQVVHI
jgi:hypothetical protein